MRGESLSPGVSPGAGLCTVEDQRGHANGMTMCWEWKRACQGDEVTSNGHSASFLWVGN